MVVGRSIILCAVCAVSCLPACGRIRFDAHGVGDANRDGSDASDDAPADGPPMLSCVGLPATCGPAGTSSCCGSPVVAGGTFFRGYDVGTDGAYPDMTNPATVSDFRLDTYEVTVGRFRQFVAAGPSTQANPPMVGTGARALNGMASQAGWDPTWNASLAADPAALVAGLNCDATYQTWANTPGVNDALPMNCINWFEAFAFCAWDGGFMPTEAEWNYAAAGGSEQRAYPWSNPASSLTIDCTYANYNPGPPCVPPNAMGTADRVGSESPMGDGKWGQAGLGGDLLEWVLDGFATYPLPCTDCANLTPGLDPVLRGDNFATDAFAARSGFRVSTPAGGRNTGVGVRCARVP
jgi:formylglycine-generating enzyme required for sulfatase activity